MNTKSITTMIHFPFLHYMRGASIDKQDGYHGDA
jgi:hypothetical protein